MDYSPLGEREVTICDSNANMLRYGRKKAASQGYTRGKLITIVYYSSFCFLIGITWVQGDATCLPFADNSFDAYTTSFGLRNVSNLNQVG